MDFVTFCATWVAKADAIGGRVAVCEILSVLEKALEAFVIVFNCENWCKNGYNESGECKDGFFHFFLLLVKFFRIIIIDIRFIYILLTCYVIMTFLVLYNVFLFTLLQIVECYERKLCVTSVTIKLPFRAILVGHLGFFGHVMIT